MENEQNYFEIYSERHLHLLKIAAQKNLFDSSKSGPFLGFRVRIDSGHLKIRKQMAYPSEPKNINMTPYLQPEIEAHGRLLYHDKIGILGINNSFQKEIDVRISTYEEDHLKDMIENQVNAIHRFFKKTSYLNESCRYCTLAHLYFIHDSPELTVHVPKNILIDLINALYNNRVENIELSVSLYDLFTDKESFGETHQRTLMLIQKNKSDEGSSYGFVSSFSFEEKDISPFEEEGNREDHDKTISSNNFEKNYQVDFKSLLMKTERIGDHVFIILASVWIISVISFFLN